MDYSAADVKKLREETGAGFADCKTALTEAKTWNDAVKYLEARSARTSRDKVVTHSLDHERASRGFIARLD